ncbi:hypothetical protein LOC67_13445 [Stieleria sp. JC731]|uniref:hypothetical protein n=1 Tax=Pirellulaceae TaxID=2691357 RepID=UPI001E2BBFAE|nr:hypothetical protein [Stieleria sp. JC731]MCC9601556.1 hypothetical protein [Stieleria sp. JC731]
MILVPPTSVCAQSNELARSVTVNNKPERGESPGRLTVEKVGETEPTFFHEPVEDTRNEKLVVTEEQPSAQVKLLGIVRPSQDSEMVTALIRINNRCYVMEQGEVRDGVLLKHIDPENRGISFESDGDLTSIELLKQTVINEAVALPPITNRRSMDRPLGRRHGDAAAKKRTTIPIAPPIDLPTLNLPGMNSNSRQELPAMPDLPDLPDIILDLGDPL